MASAEERIRALALEHGVDANPHETDDIACIINKLSGGDESDPDEVRRLLINLAIAGHLADRDATMLLADYLSVRGNSSWPKP